jgi:hypothetical protein
MRPEHLRDKKGEMNALFVFNKSNRVCFITLRPAGAQNLHYLDFLPISRPSGA